MTQRPNSNRYAKHDQCEGQLFQLIDGLAETLYNTPQDAAVYPNRQETENKVEELNDENNNAASNQLPTPNNVPVLKTTEIPQIEVKQVLATLTAARPDLFSQLSKFTTTVTSNIQLSDADGNTSKTEGNKHFIAYQNEVASWENNKHNKSLPTAQQKVEAQRLWDAAFNFYTVALSRGKSDEFIATVLNNRSTVLFAAKQYRDCALDCNYCLKLNPLYWKALQRRGSCMVKLGYETVGNADISFAETMLANNNNNNNNNADATPHYDLQFNYHDRVLHAFQNVSNYANVYEDDGAKALTAAHRLSAPPTIVHLNRSAITVDRDAKRGRFVATTQQLDAGTTVLVETPYAHAISGNACGKACSLCLRTTRMLYPCAQYRSVGGVRSRGMFCSSECARMSWELYGNYESKNIFFSVCPIDGLLASRMILRKFKQSAVLVKDTASVILAGGDNNNNNNNNEVKEFSEAPLTVDQQRELVEKEAAKAAAMLRLVLMSDATADSREPFCGIDPIGGNAFGKEHIATLCAFSAEIFPGLADCGGRESVLSAVAAHFGIFNNNNEAAELFRKALRQLTVNAFPISFQERVLRAGGETHDVVYSPIGKAVYAVGSLFNHSCDPNCVATFAGQPHAACAQLNIKIIRPVQEGEELTIAYSYPPLNKFTMHSTRARIRELRAKYGFACTCNACFNEVDEPIAKEDEQYYHKASDYFQKGRRLMREGNYKESVTVLLQSYEIVMRYISPPPRPPQWMLVATHEAIAQSYNLLGDKKKSLEHQRAALSLALQMYDKHATRIAAGLGAVALDGGDANADDDKNENNNSNNDEGDLKEHEGEGGAVRGPTLHPRNHQKPHVGLSPGVITAQATSATFLCHPDIELHANTALIQNFIRLAIMSSTLGRTEEVAANHTHRDVDDSKQLGGSAAATPLISSFTRDAKRFARRAIQLLKLHYAESAALDVELLELELISRSKGVTA